MALVSYNVFSIIRSTVQVVHGEQAAANLSIYYVTNEIAKATDGMSVVIDSECWREKYCLLTPKQLAAELKRVAQRINLKKYKKNKWTPKNKAKPDKDKTNRQHASTYKILQASRNIA